MGCKAWVAAVGLSVLGAGGAAAEVIDSSAGGFTVKTTLTIQATPEVVYRRMTKGIGEWWSADHTFWHDAHKLSLDARPGGCFCETTAGGGARHMEVVYVEEGRRLVMHGGLGPMLPMAVAASMEIRLTPVEGGTSLEMTYTVGGYSARGLNTLAAPVDGVLREQFTRLKSYSERPD